MVVGVNFGRIFLVLLLFKRECLIRTLSLDCAKKISNYSTNLDMYEVLFEFIGGKFPSTGCLHAQHECHVSSQIDFILITEATPYALPGMALPQPLTKAGRDLAVVRRRSGLRTGRRS